MEDYARYREENGRLASGFMIYTYNLYANPGPERASSLAQEEVEIMFSKTDGVLIT